MFRDFFKWKRRKTVTGNEKEKVSLVKAKT